MRKLTLLTLLSVIATSLLCAQASPNEKLKDPNQLQIKQKTLDYLFKNFNKSLQKDCDGEAYVFSDADVDKYFDLFDSEPHHRKELDSETAKKNLVASVENAKAILSALNGAKAVNLLSTKTFFGDSMRKTRVIAFELGIQDKNKGVFQHTVYFVEFDGVYKILSIQ